jgi:dihydrofolate synthase/folylpolyglutamate synthase
LLGNSLQEIAAEKAGIIKQGVPVVIGETLPETKPVFQQSAATNDATYLLAEEALKVISHSLQPESLTVAYSHQNGRIEMTTDLPGIYQVANLRTVLTAVEVLKKAGWQLEERKVSSALQNVKGLTGLAGRWEVIRQKPTVVLEVAHNKDGLEKMLAHLSQLSYGALHLVVGMVKDKDVNQVLQLLPTTAHYYFTEANIPRALPAADLQRKAKEAGLSGAVFADANAAIHAALQSAADDDLIIVCGSIFLVAEVDRLLFA